MGCVHEDLEAVCAYVCVRRRRRRKKRKIIIIITIESKSKRSSQRSEVTLEGHAPRWTSHSTSSSS